MTHESFCTIKKNMITVCSFFNLLYEEKPFILLFWFSNELQNGKEVKRSLVFGIKQALRSSWWTISTRRLQAISCLSGILVHSFAILHSSRVMLALLKYSKCSAGSGKSWSEPSLRKIDIRGVRSETKVLFIAIAHVLFEEITFMNLEMLEI